MQDAALLVIDVQKAFDDPTWGPRNNANAETNIASLIEFWRSRQGSVIHIHHSSDMLESIFHPSKVGHHTKDEAHPLPNEVIFKKTVNSAFIGTSLESYLQKNDISSLVIVGLTTDHCVSTSTRMAANLGFNVVLVSDATATFAKVGHDGTQYSASDMHNINLASLHNEFCDVQTTAFVINNNQNR
jgi:nicotinamidase-related amidase